MGTNLIVYYDKTYTNLIPNYEPGRSILGRYRFNVENETTAALTDTLQKDMGTDENGTTISEFQAGLRSYIKRQGYNVSFSSIMTSGKVNYEKAKTIVLQNKALAIFMSGYKGTTIVTNEGYDLLEYEYTKASHAVVGFGCLEVKYTLSDNSIRTDKYYKDNIRKR